MKKFLTLILPLAWLAAGCISTESTTYRDAERLKVTFESDTAARMFYETMHKTGNMNRSETKTEVSIPVVFDHKQKTVDGENVIFNAAVRKCDTNGDGKITEPEARIYADNSGK